MARAFYFLLLFLFAAPFSLHAQSVGNANYTEQAANLTLSNATTYVSMINESGYLFFSPDLRQAYSYLNISSSLLKSSPNTSIVYSDLAIGSARAAYNQIGIYREAGEFGSLVFVVAMAILVYRIMQPVRNSKKKK